jgi:hypothetical protein
VKAGDEKSEHQTIEPRYHQSVPLKKKQFYIEITGPDVFVVTDLRDL